MFGSVNATAMAALPSGSTAVAAVTSVMAATNTSLLAPSDLYNSTAVLLASTANAVVANVTAAAYELTTDWLVSTVATFTAESAATTTAAVAASAASAALNDTAMAAVLTVNGSQLQFDVDGDVDGDFDDNSGGMIFTTDLSLIDSSGNSGNSNSNGYFEPYEPCHPLNPSFNCSRDEFVRFCLGPQRLPLYQVLLVTIIFGGIFITGVLGNVLVCVVIVRHPNMHTATNYYLFSLAVSDLLYLLLGLPAEIFLYWHQYPYLFGLPFCKIRAFISEASTYVSVLTIVAFSMERFLAICHPLHLYTMSGFKRAVRIIAALWIISFISAAPFGLLTDILYLDYPVDNSTIAESAFCSMVAVPNSLPWIEVSFCVFFVIPMILIFILYGRMGAQIRASTTAQLGVQQGSMHRESRHSQSRKAVIRMLAAVVLTFFICWLPFHMQRLWFLYAKEYEYFLEINEWMFSITGFVYYVSCTINPILYNVMSHRYRVAFKDILCGKRRTVYFNNGFARDQSSFRETTVTTSLGGGNAYDRVHSVRIRSARHSTTFKDRDSAMWLKKTDFSIPIEKDKPDDPPPQGKNVVVVVDSGGGSANGRPKVYTESEAQETLLNKSNETCI